MSLRRTALLLTLAGSLCAASGLSLARDDSLRAVPPCKRAHWLRERDITDSRYEEPLRLDSLNLRMLGKWGRGASWKVTGHDILVFVSLGSEVAVVNAADARRPVVVSEIQARSLVYNARPVNDLLYIAAQGQIEVWNIVDPANPEFISRFPVVLNDIFVQDTMVHVISEDSFKVYSFADPANPRLIGACSETGHSVFVAGNHAYIGDRWGVYLLSLIDPAHPQRVASLSAGEEAGGVWVEGNHCYYTTVESGLHIANVRNPASPWQEGQLASVGGADVHRRDIYLYLPGLDIIDVSDSSNPTRISHLELPGWEYGVWARSPYTTAFVADHWEGLEVIDISDPVHPVLDTSILGADQADDVEVVGSLAIVANHSAGVKIIDISDPTRPTELASYDSVGRFPQYLSATGRDSLAYTGSVDLRVLSIADPRYPVLLGTAPVFDRPQDAVVRDSLLYFAEDYRFEIFSIANPRAPRLVGSCGLADNAWGLFVKDTFAYIANSGGVQAVDIARPANPVLVASHGQLLYTLGIYVADTVAYLASSQESLWVWSFADPLNPYRLGAAPVKGYGYDVTGQGGLAFVGSFRLDVVDISDPRNPRTFGYYDAPYRVRRVTSDGSYVYAACFGAGVCIFETTASSDLAESKAPDCSPQPVTVFPNPASGQVSVLGAASMIAEGRIRFYDAAGRQVLDVPRRSSSGYLTLLQQVDLSGLPSGTYFMRVEGQRMQTEFRMVVKIDRR